MTKENQKNYRISKLAFTKDKINIYFKKNIELIKTLEKV